LGKSGEAQAETYRLHQTGNRKVNRGWKKQSASRAKSFFKPATARKPNRRKKLKQGGHWQQQRKAMLQRKPGMRNGSTGQF
jgi:hypothetical protein